MLKLKIGIIYSNRVSLPLLPSAAPSFPPKKATWSLLTSVTYGFAYSFAGGKAKHDLYTESYSDPGRKRVRERRGRMSHASVGLFPNPCNSFQ